jgi:hypothetical protein
MKKPINLSKLKEARIKARDERMVARVDGVGFVERVDGGSFNVFSFFAGRVRPKFYKSAYTFKRAMKYLRDLEDKKLEQDGNNNNTNRRA